MNHLVPEQMFSTETDKAQGISAVKALAIASQQGQKIWTINQSNLDLALSRINLGADAENDIRNAVYAGKIATAHEARINFNGWIGEGYILMDPNTGAGGYMISGGGNGSETNIPQSSGLSFFDAMQWVTVLVAVVDTLKVLLSGFKYGGPFALISGYFNVISSIISFNKACGDPYASALMGFAATAMFLLGVLLTVVSGGAALFGPMGFIVSIGIAIMMHVVGLHLSESISNGCRE
ncbi:hypothetical protein D0C16_13040 [Cellvibrio sp. KY-GH-1]|uniref:hypothetical protein n=1 Tax=Cellvibrio sp. KY-GH-1 TaxID=2303332 RepID=UPI001243BD50|nr:hypothetical protein [Cellvibrio sp. KY-GH-1]QEY16814.1 hypothetical protein D0C16_13040 [Cellvibrio sp. KY-GH-1]